GTLGSVGLLLVLLVLGLLGLLEVLLVLELLEVLEVLEVLLVLLLVLMEVLLGLESLGLRVPVLSLLSLEALRGRGRTSPPPVQSQSQLQPTSPLHGPSPYSGPTRGLTERREPESRPVSPASRAASPVRTIRAGQVSRSPLPPVPAFLQGSLHEEIWLCRPPGFTGSFPAGTQWSLWRPVYGLRQVPREWHDTLRTTLAALGFAPSTADPSLFLRTDTTLPPFYVLVYVDDLVFATADTEALAHVKSELQKRHTCTDL
ncbi:unnamed protein product, partial [Closterium sp. NIES-53]